jgi:hypothetical protein
MLTLIAGVPSGFAQQSARPAQPDRSSSGLPSEPAPTATEPLSLRDMQRDFSKPAGRLLGNPLKAYMPTKVAPASFVNSVRLDSLLKDGKIYLSLSDALALALENNYDIAVARYNLDIADTDILRAKAGASLRGVSTGVLSNTLGGATSTLSSGGGPAAPRSAPAARPQAAETWCSAPMAPDHFRRSPTPALPDPSCLIGTIASSPASSAPRLLPTRTPMTSHITKASLREPRSL